MLALNEKNVLPFVVAGLLVVGVVYFLLRKTISDAAGAVAAGAGVVNDARLNVASNIADVALSWFHPNPTTPDVYVTVNFADGTKHAISQRDIDARGFFVGTKSVYPWYDGKRYRIGLRADGTRHAVEVK